MFEALSESWETIDVFMERGGPVLNFIAILLFVKWSLMIERFWFLRTIHKSNVVAALSEWEARIDKKSWNAHAIRQELVSRVTLDLRSTIPLIEVLVVVCPLFGLLGTVTGMIEVFYVMAVTGGGDAKQMSGGVARATIPTMAGMVGALSGIFASNILKVRTNRELRLLEDHLEIQHA
jgi:biopolymer transport protein ExbB|tara:strand:- start:975 stop:1508 length:534 start_codon:yes stop_codon:yes gene_type:complete